ncbi:MAG: hypothetical protein CMJ00_00070 [Pelagibacteraceae bacterium]|nr:hypothetical protein [Pelagibacteraceae bacterium]|tara:strand:+ start:610 stop:1317 length:708 start_codon:yes stop_codon:yes gene_type:complete
MHKNIDKIKKLESSPKIIKNLFSKSELDKFINLYRDLPTTVHNKKQNVIKKRWLKNYSSELEKLFTEKVKNEIGDFRMDNLKDENNNDILGLFQESYNPIGLHVDAGFNLDEIIFKQTLIPLTSKGSTVIFKNKFYGNSTNFTIDENELKIKDLKYGQNLRSSDHLNIFEKKPFNKDNHKKYLNHEKIENLSGLEIDIVYEWELGSMLIFDRTRLHCSSSLIDGKKIGLTTFTKK